MERFVKDITNANSQAVVLSGVIKIINNNELSILDNNYDGIGSDFERVE